MNSRNNTLDNMKAVGIILVIAGHILQSRLLNPVHLVIYNFIYSFHMPLFFFCSGYLFTAQDTNRPLLASLRGKGGRLLLPFFSWYLFGFLFQKNMNFVFYIKRLFISPDWGLWFLWALFFIYFLNYFIQKCCLALKKNSIQTDFLYVTTLVFFVLILKKINIQALGVGQVYYHCLFFTLGAIFRKYEGTFSVYKKSLLFFLTIGFFIVEWLYFHKPTIYFKFACGLLCPPLLYLVMGLESSIFGFIGRKTLSIYAIHFLLLNFIHIKGASLINVSGGLLFIANIFLLLLISLIISYGLEQNSILSLIFLGQQIRPKKGGLL